MKKYLSFIPVALLMGLFAGCSDEQKEQTASGATPMQSVSIRTTMAEISRADAAINADDPTMSAAAARSSHVMGVVLGSGADKTQTTYNYRDGRWIPSSDPVIFPDNMRRSVQITLRKEGAAVQDGTAQGLIDADPLSWEREDQVPVRDLANVPMKHVKTLVEFELGTIAATRVQVGQIEAYHVQNGNKWQAIIEPQTADFMVYVTVNGAISTAEVTQDASPTDGVFRADYRYTVPLVLNGTELVVGTIGVGRWREGAGGTAAGVPSTRFVFDGLAGEQVDVWFAGVATPTSVTLDASGEASIAAGVPMTTVTKITYKGTDYPIGRKESGDILLRFVGGALAFRSADGAGFIPVNSIAELKMIDKDAASRGEKYLQQADIDLLGGEWKPLSEMKGTYDGGDFSILGLHVSAGVGNAGLFASNSGTIRRVVIASATALNGQWHSGFVCGENKGTIELCENKASITDGGKNTLGGICGMNNNGTISKCKNSAALTIASTVPSDGTGGICGYASKGKISGCTNTGAIGGKPKNTGGIVGNADGCEVSDCANTGDLILPWGAGDNNGGIAGVTYNTTLITRCYNTGTVTVEGSQAGGICGQLNANGTISSCYNTGKAGAKWNSGGIAGQSTNALIVACHNDGLVQGQTAGWAGAGGICGFHKGTITACYNTGDVVADSAAGSLVGEHNSGSISYCYWSGDLVGVPSGGSGTQTGNSKFGSATWPTPSTHEAWKTTAESPTAYWRTLGAAGGSYPKLSWEK